MTKVTKRSRKKNHFCAMFEMLGYIGAVLIGVSLGMIGGGGSILTVPVLVYLMGVSPVMATAYSLFIVGMSAAVGGVRYAKDGLVHFRTAVYFGVPSIIAVFATRKYLIPALPDELLQIGAWVLTKDAALMLLFALLMLVASVGMIRKRKQKSHPTPPTHSWWKTASLVLLEGLIVGTLTGLVGAGGGFLIIPALVLVSRLPMKTAVGTSLVIIAAKSLIGFIGDATNYEMDWPLLVSFSVLAVAGILLGTFLSSKVDGPKLKTAFGWFVLVMGIFILWKEVYS